MVTLALYQPDIAQNLGTSLRTCACLGVDVEVIEPCGFPFDDRKIRRSGMDYINYVRYRRHTSWQHFLAYEWGEKRRIILLSSKASVPYSQVKFKASDILLVGRETAGVPKAVADACDLKATIPMKEGMRSLNVAVASAMVLGEALRQLRAP